MPARSSGAALLAAACVLAGCAPTASVERTADRPAAAAGIGAAWRLPSLGGRARRAAAISRLRCGSQRTAWGVHIELFAHGHVVIVAAGVGVAPPRRHSGAYVTGGRCRYPVWTSEPTGVVRVARPGLTLGDLFAVWGQPLTRGRLGRWRVPVVADVDGIRWRGDPRVIPLHRHAQIVVQAGAPRVRPHAAYRFPEGL
jgi:hypothetical protein